jgi:hypothetical protein
MNEPAEELDMTSNSVWRETPSLSPMTKASATARVVMPTTMLLQIFEEERKKRHGHQSCTSYRS